MINSGQPKNEYLIEKKGKQKKFRETLLRKYGVPKDKLLFTYLPTFRDHRDTLKLSSLIGAEMDGLLDTLEEVDGVLLEKFHFADAIPVEISEHPRIYPVDAREDSTELLLATDV